MWDPPHLRKDTRRHQNESALEGAVIVTAITLSPGRLRVVWVTSCVTPSPFWGIFSWADFSLSLAAVKSQTGQCWREISHRNLYVLSDGIIMVCLFSIIVSVSCSLAKLFVTLWTIACQAPLSMGLLSQEYWSRLPFPPPGDLPDAGIEPRSPALQADSLPPKPPGKPGNAGPCFRLQSRAYRMGVSFAGPLPFHGIFPPYGDDIPPLRISCSLWRCEYSARVCPHSPAEFWRALYRPAPVLAPTENPLTSQLQSWAWLFSIMGQNKYIVSNPDIITPPISRPKWTNCW